MRALDGRAVQTLTAASRKEEALWLLDKLVPDSGVNNIPVALQVDGKLRTDALQRAVDLLLRRHQALRTVFYEDESVLRREILEPERFRVEVQPLSSTREELQAALTAFAATPFDFDGRPLVRAAHFECETGDVFCVVVHHLVFDTTSAVILLDEFAKVYDVIVAGGELPAEAYAEIPAVPDAEPKEESLAFWREHLRGFDAGELDLSLAGNEVATPTLAGAALTHDLSPEARATVRRLQRELRAPEAVILLAAYYLLLARHGAGPDIVIGSPTDIRGQRAAGVIGYHISTLPLRVRVDLADGFRGLVRKTRDVFLEAISRSDVHVDLLLPEIERSDAGWRTTLFRHLFNFQPYDPFTDFTFAGMKATPPMVENGFSRLDLEFVIQSGKDITRVKALYSAETHDRADVRALVRRYDALLVALGEDPDRPTGEVPLGAPDDRAVIDAANDTGRDGDDAAVLASVRARVLAGPAALAVVDGDREVDYGTLWAAAERTRESLAEAGVVPGEVVAVLAGRSAELVAAVLGVWLSGCAYLPIDPDHPAQRIAYQLTDSGAAAVLTGPGVTAPAEAGSRVLPMVPVGAGGGAPGEAPAVDLGTCAYLIYTSGSTGKPKGTRVAHGNLANLIAHFEEELSPAPGDRTLWMTTFAFDISALELFLPLVTGGALVIAPDRARTDGALLLDLLTRHRVGIVQATPTTWRLVVDECSDQLAGRRVLCGGEPLAAPLARRLLATGCELRNVYGPTETTIWSTSGRIDGEKGAVVDVGRPLRNTRVFVADPRGAQLPVGVSGELCIAGSGVALGYHERAELTAERFPENAEFGRHYRTGDLARWLPDGTLEILGRVDRQIKLRGNRIELGEVESVLMEHDAVAAAAVVVVGDRTSDGVLVAFLVVRGEGDVVDEVWAHARAALPGSAVPQEFLVIDALPVNANEKVDYPALTRRAETHRAELDRASGAASGHDDELVDSLISLYQTLLERGDVTANSNFFVNGGHSLLAALLVQRLDAITGVRLPLADVFAHPTPIELADHVRTR